MAKAPSLRKDWTKGTQRTRKLSTGKALWSWRNGKERFVRARRGTAGAKPYTMKVVRTVFNGGHEETYGNATRLVPTQRSPRLAGWQRWESSSDWGKVGKILALKALSDHHGRARGKAT